MEVQINKANVFSLSVLQHEFLCHGKTFARDSEYHNISNNNNFKKVDFFLDFPFEFIWLSLPTGHLPHLPEHLASP